MFKYTVVLLIILCLCSPEARTEELKNILERFQNFVTEKNYPKALEELGWAQKEVEKLHQSRLKAFFPDTLAELKGEVFQPKSALGMIAVERKYRSEENKVVTVALTGGSPGGTGAGAFGNLAALGQMASIMQGTQPGVDSFRIKGKTASLNAAPGNSRSELSIFLESGSVLRLEVSASEKGEMLKKMAEGLPLEDLDSYLRGMQKKQHS